MLFKAFTRDGDFGNGLTVNGSAATLVSKHNTRASRWEYHYRFIGAPASTTLPISFATTGTPGRTECESEAINNAVQTTTPDAEAFISSSTANPFVMNLTTIADNCWVFAGVDVGATGTAGTNAHLVEDNVANGGAMQLYDNSGVAPVHPAGSFTMNVANPSAGANIAIISSWAPVASTNFTRSFSDSISVGASRVASLSRSVGFIRAVADSIAAGASRVATIAFTNGKSRSLSDSIGYGAGRTVALSRSVSYLRALATSIANAASRFVTVRKYPDPKSGFSMMRSTENNDPIALDDKTDTNMRSTEDINPLAMDDQSIL